MEDTETTTPYVTAPNAPAIYLGDDARIYARHGTGLSVVGLDYISVTLHGVDHDNVGRLLMTPAAAEVMYRELGSALTNRRLARTAEQVSA